MYDRTTIEVDVTEEEHELLAILRDTKWGEVTIVVKNGVPVMVKTVQKDVKLTR